MAPAEEECDCERYRPQSRRPRGNVLLLEFRWRPQVDHLRCLLNEALDVVPRDIN